LGTVGTLACGLWPSLLVHQETFLEEYAKIIMKTEEKGVTAFRGGKHLCLGFTESEKDKITEVDCRKKM